MPVELVPAVFHDQSKSSVLDWVNEQRLWSKLQKITERAGLADVVEGAVVVGVVEYDKGIASGG